MAPTLSKLSTLSKQITGISFQTDEGVRFKVLEGEFFSSASVARQHRKYLGDLRQGLLVAVSFFGTRTPVITVKGGVVKLAKVELSGMSLERAGVISQGLGLSETRQPLGLYLT